MKFVPLPKDEWLLIVQLRLAAIEKERTLGKTPYGLVGVRVATSLSVQDGGGMIRNSQGSINEQQVLGEQAEWVDYSGPVMTDVVEEITLMDHPGNTRHPTHFHVRDDGCMFAAPTYKTSLVIRPEEPLLLRYGIYIHSGVPPLSLLEQCYQSFVNKVDAK